MTEVKRWEDLPLTLTAKEAAELCRVTVKVIKEKFASGEIPANKVGRAWRVDRDALRAYLHGSDATGGSESRSAKN